MKSEIEIPDGWEVKRLDEITTIIISNVDKKMYVNELPVSLCNYKDVYDNHYINSKLNFMDGTAKKVEIEKFTLLKNDVIITKDSETKIDIANSSVVIEELKNVICGYHLAILRPMPSILNGIFLMNVLKIKPVNNHFVKYAQGLTRFGLTVDAINRAKIPLPPFEEQQKIADILSKVDKQINLTEQIMDKTEELKKGLMQKLLTKGIGHTKFKKTELGEIPEEWDTLRFGDIAAYKNGINFNKTQKGKKGILTIDVKNMFSNSLFVENIDYRVDIDLSDDSSYLLKKGDILFVRSSLKKEGVGWATLYNGNNEKTTFCGFIIRARLKNSDFSPSFLTYYFRANKARNKLIGGSGQVAITNINQGSLSSIKVPTPPIKEQKQITSILSKVDEQIQDNKNELKHLKELKKGLMQDLLTGKVRVSV